MKNKTSAYFLIIGIAQPSYLSIFFVSLMRIRTGSPEPVDCDPGYREPIEDGTIPQVCKDGRL